MSFFARVRVNVNIHMIALQLLVNQECRTTNIRSKAKQSRFTIVATTRVITCTCVHIRNCKKHFHVLLEFSVMSVHRNFFTGKKIKLLAGFELASSVLGVLGLAHYTRAGDIVIFLQL